MKKSLIIALGAIALVACTKTSVSYEQTGEIGFAPVVRKNSTKAAVQGATFPEQNIKVFGYYDNSMPVESSYADGNFAVEYLPGVEFAKKGATWAGATTSYYWPKTGSMLFAGYSPVDFDGVTFTLASNTFSVAECPQPEFSATKDLLYAGRSEKSVLGGTVSMTFSHALSWVTIKAKAAAADQIKITNIKFVGLAAKAFSAGLPEWTVSGTKEQLNVFAPTSAFAVPDAETLVESNENCGLVFPQELTNAEIVISYEMNNGAGQWFAQYPFVKKLNSLKSGADTINKWEAGKHYTYIINFSTTEGGPDSSNEITIAPTVNDWTPVDVGNISAN